MLARVALVMSLAGFVFFNYAQHQGWNLFADNADPQALRPSQAARLYHK